MVIVSYGTRDGHYDRCLNRLRESIEPTGMRHDLRVIPRDGGKRMAQLQKPRFLLKSLDRHGEPIVWLDADSMVVGAFELPGGDWDIGLIPNNVLKSRSKNPMCSFVIGIRPTDRAKRFLEVWRYLCKWPNLSKYQDHKRMTWTREICKHEYTEIDLSECLTGKLVRDIGNVKECAV